MLNLGDKIELVNPIIENFNTLQNVVQYVYEHFLSKPYSDTASCKDEAFTNAGGKKIPRPNHALRHVMTKMALAPVILKAYQDKSYRNHKQYEKIDANELLKIQIALLFSVTGRQSEASVDMKKGLPYKKYRQDSADNFRAYVSEHLSHLFTEQDIDKYTDYILKGGYEGGRKGPELDILNDAHTLELMRCWTYDRFGQNIKAYSKHFPNGKEIVDYARDLIRAGGERILGYAPFGEEGNFEMDGPRFAECSTDVQACIRHLCAVKPPNLEMIEAKLKTTSPNHSPAPRKLSEEENMRLVELQEMEFQLKDEIASLRVLGEENEVKIYIQTKEAELIEIKKEITKLTGADIQALESKTKEQRIYSAKSYQVFIKNKLCHDGVLRDEIRIPGDNNCCYNSAIVAAKHAGIRLPVGITNHYELRQEVARRMTAEYLNDPDDSVGDFAAAIEGYNREFRTNIETFNEYIKEVEKLDTWGGEYELKKMAEILGMNIVVFSDRQPQFTIDTDNPQAIAYLHHTGNHYNFYVTPDTWQGLPHDDPVLLFDERVDEIRHLKIKAALKEASSKRTGVIETDLYSLNMGNTTQGIRITYKNYIDASKLYNEYGREMKKTTQALKVGINEMEEKERLRLEANLMKNEKLYVKQGKNLEEMRKAFKTDPSLGFDNKLRSQYSTLMKEYNHQINLLTTVNQHVRSLFAKKIAIITKGVQPASDEFLKIKQEIEEALITQHKVKEIAKVTLLALETEMTFILREVTPQDDHTQMIARYKRKEIQARKQLDSKAVDDTDVDLDVASVVHLKNFLKANYNPAHSLKDNIKQYFQDPLIRAMLHQGGEVIERKLYDHPDAGNFRRVSDYQREGGLYDEELLDHFCDKLEQMVLAEAKNAGNYALYNAMSANLGVGNDVIRELSSLFSGKGYDAMFRLFSEGFDYDTAEDFRKDVYDTQKIMDGGSEFHSKGLCCGLSPFQPLQNESPLDFWSHNRNVQTFDRWDKEILPKLRSIIADEKTIQELSKEYEELIVLSEQLGARMTQFLMSPDDIDKYAWLSGAYGFKLPAVTTKLGHIVETEKLSEALDYYTEAPDEFIKEADNKRKIFMTAPENAEKFIDKFGKNHKDEVYDVTYSSEIENRKNLGQFQARLYLHPDLFEPGRMQVNTYYSLPDNPKIEAEYNEKLHQFSEKVCGHVIRAQRQKSAKADGVPEELQQSIFLHPFKYTDEQAHKDARTLLRQMVQPAKVLESDPIVVSDWFKNIQAISQQPISANSKINQIAIQMNKKGSTDEQKQEALYQLFLEAITIGDVETFRTLKAYSLSTNYNHKYFPINLDAIPDNGKLVNSFIRSANYGHTAMLQELLTTREENIGVFNRPAGHLALRRMVVDEKTADTPLHYLAQLGNVEGFKMLVQSLISRRSYQSYLFYTGIHLNKEGNTPLHILAFSDPSTHEDRNAILSYLLDDKSSQEFDILFGANAVTTVNQFGLSPIMVAALTQNIEAIVLFSQKAKLSSNQRLIYLWIAQAPYQHLAEIQNNIAQYGKIPGFLPNLWEMPEQFRKLQNEQKPEGMSSKPKSIDELKIQFEQALLIKGNKEVINGIYSDLLAAQNPEAVNAYLSLLLADYSQGAHKDELDNLVNIVKQYSLKLSTTPKGQGEIDSPLLRAAKSGDMHVVETLLTEKESLNTKRTSQDAQGKTALHYLVERTDSEKVTTLLLNSGSWSQLAFNASNPTCIQDKDGNTAVHLIAQSANITILDAIEKSFGNWSGYGTYKQFYQASYYKNNEGKTPIMIAVLEHPDKADLIKHFGRAMGFKDTDPELKLYKDLASAIVSKNEDQINEKLRAVSMAKTWSPIDISVENLLAKAPKQIKRPF